MPMLMIDLLSSDTLLEGQINRKLLEVRAGLFVGSLSKKQMEILWEAVVKSKPKAALLVYAAKTEIGVSMKATGDSKYQVVNSDGLQLVRYKTVRNIR
jgi:CRISPR-associated protein Cas2